MHPLDKMILRAIPVNYSCSLNEHRNKVTREWLRKQFDLYLSDQLSKQFNARPLTAEPTEVGHKYGLGENAN